jgi:DNA polymerase-3 subunit epsilon
MNSIPNPNRQRIIEIAQARLKENIIYLDTETTGIDRNAEIVEIAIIDREGNSLFQSLVRPSIPIPQEASKIHGITDEMVQTSLSWPALWPSVRPYLLGRSIAGYNIDYDLRLMQQSYERYRLPWRDHFSSLDIMQLFSAYYGEWDPARQKLRWFRLEEAGRLLGIALPNSHRALDDTLLARAVLHRIAGLNY